MTTRVHTFPDYPTDFTHSVVRQQLVDTLYSCVTDEVKALMGAHPSTADLEGDEYQEKLDEILAYLDEHLVIKFID